MTRTEWIMLGTALAAPAAYWAAVLVCEFMAARAESDGVKDWRDLFWPKMLARLNSSKYARLVAEKEPQ